MTSNTSRQHYETYRITWYKTYRETRDKYDFVSTYKQHQQNLQERIWYQEVEIRKTFRRSLHTASRLKLPLQPVQEAFAERIVAFRQESKKAEDELQKKYDDYVLFLDDWYEKRVDQAIAYFNKHSSRRE